MSVYRRNRLGDWIKKDFETRDNNGTKYTKQLEASLLIAKNVIDKMRESSYFDQQIILELRKMNLFMKAEVKMLRLVIMFLAGALLWTVAAVCF